MIFKISGGGAYFLALYRRFHRFSNTILIIDYQGLGDLILTYSNIKLLKLSKKYRDYKVVLVTRHDFANLIKYTDISVDEIFVFDAGKFLDNRKYNRKILRRLRKYNAEVIIDASQPSCPFSETLTPAPWVECIAKNIISKTFYSPVYKNVSYGNFVTNFIAPCDDNKFLTYLFHYYFEQICEEKIEICLPELKQILDLRKRYVLIAPFSGNEQRIWNLKSWANIIDYVIRKYNYDVIVTGGLPSDFKNVEKLYSYLINKNKCHNCVGKIELNFMTSLFSVADLLIAAESGTVHIANNAENVNLPVICLSPGNAYKLFHPYEWGQVSYIYPDRVNELISAGLEQELAAATPCSVNEISVEAVKIKIDKLLSVALTKTS